MGTFVRSLTAVSSALPVAAIAVASLSSSTSSSSYSPSPSNFRFPIKPNLPLCASLCSSSPFNSFEPRKSQRPPLAALHMDSVATDLKPKEAGILPELMTEFMVDMKCEGCVSAVKDKLLTVYGVESVDVDVSNQVVRVLGSLPVKTMADALEQTGRKARLIGQGNPNAQVNMELARIEATFSGLSPGKHGWSINKFGDLTKGAESTGKVYNPTSTSSEKPVELGSCDMNSYQVEGGSKLSRCCGNENFQPKYMKYNMD